MIAGMLPLALGDAIGAEYRKALGTVVIGGLASSLVLTLFVVPLVYVWVRRAAEPGPLRKTPPRLRYAYAAVRRRTARHGDPVTTANRPA